MSPMSFTFMVQGLRYFYCKHHCMHETQGLGRSMFEPGVQQGALSLSVTLGCLT